MRYSLLFGPKRYAEYREEGGEIIALSHAEAALGGFFVDPPLMSGRSRGHRRWSSHVAERAALHAHLGGGEARGSMPWDPEGTLPFPSLRRLSVKSRETARTLPPAQRVRPGTRYLEGLVAVTQRGLCHSVVALDPGGDLSDWAELPWYGRPSGQGVRVTTDPRDVGAVLLQTLEDRAREYEKPPRTQPLDLVVVEPKLVRVAGRVSDVIDADLDGLENLEGRRHEFSGAQIRDHFVEEIRTVGPVAFARRTGIAPSTASAIARGASPRARTLRRYVEALKSLEANERTCSWEECSVALTRSNQKYCSRAHADRDYRRRKNASRSSTLMPKEEALSVSDFSGLPRCHGCSALLLGAAAARGVCRDCREGGF